MDTFKELIKKSERKSKEDFLKFVTGIYGVDESFFEHIWDVPVIAPYENDSIITTSLSTKSKDDLLDILDEFVDNELGDSDGCFIDLSKIESEFSDKELEEWLHKLNSGEVQQCYNAIIVYNDLQLRKKYKEFMQDNSKSNVPKNQEELEQIFIDYINGVITHERCHLNANYLVTEVRDAKFVSETINGSEISSWDYDDLVTGKVQSRIDATDYADRNEVLIDTLSQMMNNYQDGDTVEDCLYRIIDNRDGKSQYDFLDDREVLAMYILFPDELTKWATFGAYDFVRENKLQKKIMEVCGTDEPLPTNKLIQKIREYTSSLEEGVLSDKQRKMLEMLGINNIRKIDKHEMKVAATSDKAFDALEVSILDIRAFINSLQNKNNSQEK